jgi:uncharacterized protein YraI
MPETRWLWLPLFFIFSASAVYDHACAEVASQKGVIQGATEVSLRAGPGIDQPRKAILAEGEQVTVQAQQGDWLQVETNKGQQGYVHKSLVRLIAQENAAAVSMETTAAKPAADESQPETKSSVDKPVAPPQSSGISAPTPAPQKRTETLATPSAKTSGALVDRADDLKTAQEKSPSLIQLLEGREPDMILWAAIAVAFFLIGWICGGNFYLRRDRVKRTRLRF